MSRQLDFSKPLTDDEKAYAEQRGLLDPQGVATGITGTEPSATADRTTPTGVGLNQVELRAVGGNTALEAAEAAGVAAAQEAPEGAYEEWNIEALKAELEKRELSKSGSKADLISRLKDDDADKEGA